MNEPDANRDVRSLDDLLANLDACGESRRWAEGKTLHEIWTTCERGDWLLWLAAQMEGRSGWHTRQRIVLAACACAETALKHVPEGEDRPRLAIEVARRWAGGTAEPAEVWAARDAARHAYLGLCDRLAVAALAALDACALADAYAADHGCTASQAAEIAAECAWDAAVAAATVFSVDLQTGCTGSPRLGRSIARREMAKIVRGVLAEPLGAATDGAA